MTTATTTLTHSGDVYHLSVTLASSPVVIQIAQARDAYQLAQAEGYIGTRVEWLASLRGTPGKTWVNLSVAAYEALTTEQKEDESIVYNLTDFTW